MGFTGQAHILERLKNEIKNGTLGHAYAFTGEKGIGKRTLAHYMAKTILCTEKGNDIEPCGKCRSCRSFEEGVNPNFRVIRNETKKILIRQIRDMIEDISVRPAEGKKVYLIEEADLMTVDAQNCLLKTLEEPPPYCIILLTTSVYESLLLTIRSRVAQLRLKPYTEGEIKTIAKANGIDIRGKEYLTSLCGGIPGRIFELASDKSFEENRNIVMRFVFEADTRSRLDFNQYLSKNKSAVSSCMDILESIYRDALMVQCSVTDGLINSDKKDNIIKYARGLSPDDIFAKISGIEEIRSNLKRYMNYQLAVDMLTLAL
ncbi:MAG TPA: DNA polymerase III subunit delta' [Clostridiaceae bacterium]|nr:DNA polymerase III subunit delta' [Clostridiaceae bacterium]